MRPQGIDIVPRKTLSGAKSYKRMEGPPLKKQRLEGVTDKKDEWDPVVPPVDDEFGAKYTREENVGITEFINQDFEGFDCILKYRYFLK